MWFWVINIFISSFLCACFTGYLIPKILLVAYRKNLFDEPDSRKIHHSAIPRLGGFSFKPILFFSISLLMGINIALGHTEIIREIDTEVYRLTFLFCAVMLLYIVGLADDLIGIRYSAKFVVQIMCGILLIAADVWFQDLHGIFGIHEISPWIGYPFTILVVVFVINAINLIDGIDGLAAGLCSFALLVYGVVFFLIEQYFYSMLSFSVFGILIPFFYYNVYGNVEKHEKIFMGDTGSLTIGIMLCFLSIKLYLGFDEGGTEYNPIAVAFSPLIIPCFDVLRVFSHRIRNHKSPFSPDKNHIHHRLYALGIGLHTIMVLLILGSILITICNMLLSAVMNITLLIAINVIVLIAINRLISKKLKEKQNQVETTN